MYARGEITQEQFQEMRRAIDLGCGTGANAIYVAQQGFDVTGVDYVEAVMEQARGCLSKVRRGPFKRRAA